jgi:hypothetical protein
MKTKIKIHECSVLFIALVMLYITCDVSSINEHEPQFNVYTVLINQSPYTEVFVDRTYDIDELSEPYVDDAFVTLSINTTVDTMLFDTLFASGRYIKWNMTIQPGTTYYLEVSKQGFDTLFGETKVPDAFQFINQPDDTITLQDTVIFSRSNGAIVYYCLFRSYEHFGIKDEFWLKPDTLDSFVKIRVGDYIGSLPEGLCDITITAFDPNYYKYHFEPDDSLMQAGVTGGLGLCGSSWREEITLYLNIPE